MKLFILAAIFCAVAARADISDPGSLTLGANAVVSGSMTIVGPIAISTSGAGVFALSASTGINVINGPVVLGSGAFVQWADGSTSTTAAVSGTANAAVLSATQTFSGANTFVSSVTLTGNLAFIGGAVVSSSMTLTGPVSISTSGPAVYALSTSTGILVTNGPIVLGSGAYVRWADGSTSTTAASGGGGTSTLLTSTQTFSGANTFLSSFTVQSEGRAIVFSTSTTPGTYVLQISSAGAITIGSVSAPVTVGGSNNLLAVSTQTDVTSSRSGSTVYQNTNRRLMMVEAVGVQVNGTSCTIYAFTDTKSSPTTEVAENGQGYSTPYGDNSITFIVLPGNYYEVFSNCGIRHWVEIY